jgi:hypothetical protein
VLCSLSLSRQGLAKFMFCGVARRGAGGPLNWRLV